MGANFSCLGDNLDTTTKNVADVRLFSGKEGEDEEGDWNGLFMLNDEEVKQVQGAVRGYFVRKNIKAPLACIREAKSWFNVENHYPRAEKPLKDIQNAIVTMLEQNLPEILVNIPDDGVQVQEKPAVTLKDGRIYEGSWDKKGKMHGKGTLINPDGSKIIGCFKEGILDGKGRIIQTSGIVFEGEFKEGKLNGSGNIYGNHGGKFSGTLVDGKLHGIGVEEWPDGMRYEGEYKNGLRQGKGLLTCCDGSTYEGDFYGDKMHGQGTYIWKIGNKYKGSWGNNKMHGNGVFEWPDGRKYEGEFENDQKSGHGKMTWPDGRIYDGEWIDGKQHGKGLYTFYKADKLMTRTGIWEYGSRTQWIE